MDITYFGHSAFKLKGRSASLVTDPFDSDKVGLKFQKVEADIVTVSHNHSDHNAVSSIVSTTMVITEPGEYEIKGVSIVGLPMYHDDKSGADRGENVVYVIEIDGLRVCHLGDLGHDLSDKHIEAIGDIDVLFVPVGGIYTIGSEVAAEIVRNIEPTIAVPMHYQTQGLNPDTFLGLSPVEDFLKAVGLPVETLPKLTVRKELLDENQKVVVMERK